MKGSTKDNFRFYELDVMRFLAALAVLLYHYTFGASRVFALPEFGADKLLRYGYLGVDAFFMISGYVVLMSSMHKPPKYFFISRVVRLYPAYWICCMLTFVILYFGKISQPGVPEVTFKLLAYNLTMLHGFFGKPDLNGVFWTLTYEVTFYFIILLISALKLWKSLLPIIILWLSYTLLAGPDTANNAFNFLLIPKYSCCFIAGMLFYLLRTKYTAAWKIYALLLICYLINIKHDVSIMLDMNNFYHDAGAYNEYVMIIIITVLYIFFLCSALKKLNLPTMKYIAKLGVLTYPLYLIHGFGIGIFMLWSDQINKYLLLGSTTLFMIFLSYLIYRFIEEKSRTKLKSLVNSILNFNFK